MAVARIHFSNTAVGNATADAYNKAGDRSYFAKRLLRELRRAANHAMLTAEVTAEEMRALYAMRSALPPAVHGALDNALADMEVAEAYERTRWRRGVTATAAEKGGIA